MFEKLSVFATFIKELATSQNLTLQLSAATTFGISLILLWLGLNTQTIILTILFIFPVCMSLGLGIDKIIEGKKNKRKQKQELIKSKLGLLGEYVYTYELNKPWSDQNHLGMGWVILVEDRSRTVFLQKPVCLECKTNLISRNNESCTGIYLECTDCKARFDVDDVGEKRALANASLQGDVRKNPQNYFQMRI